MNKKELIVINTIWYKIYNFFKKIFFNKNNKNNSSNVIEKKKDKNNFIQNISYKNEIINLNRKKDLAEKLMNSNLSIEDLSECEVDEMIEYFTTYINDMNQKLEQIKENIIILKNNNNIN